METVELTRDCEAVAIPKGVRQSLPKGTVVRIVQQRPGGGYTISAPNRSMYRIEAQDADALGLRSGSAQPAEDKAKLTEQLVWDTLRTVRDPELPVNIVELGLVYSCSISQTAPGSHAIAVRMAMTSPGCSMSDVLKSEVERKLRQLPEVADAYVEVVFDPPWDPSRMSEETRLQLGMDLGSKPGLVQIAPNRS